MEVVFTENFKPFFKKGDIGIMEFSYQKSYSGNMWELIGLDSFMSYTLKLYFNIIVNNKIITDHMIIQNFGFKKPFKKLNDENYKR